MRAAFWRWRSVRRAGDHLVGNERVDGVVESSPCDRQRIPGGDFCAEVGIGPSQPWGKDSAVGLGEPGGDASPEGGELVALGSGNAIDHPLSFQPAQVVGGLAAGVGEVLEQRSDPLHEIRVGETGQAVNEPHDG